MSKLSQIPVLAESVRCAGTAPQGSASAVVMALLSEIEAKLDVLAQAGEDASIDLRWLARMPQELALLREALGVGEVSATVSNIGSSLVQETAVPCVWWVSHRNEAGGLLGEFVEITEVPDLLRSDRLSIPQGLADLRVRCAQLPTPAPLSPKTEGNTL